MNIFQRQELIQKIAVKTYKYLGYVVPSDYDFQNSEHPTEQAVWCSATDAVDLIIEELDLEF